MLGKETQKKWQNRGKLVHKRKVTGNTPQNGVRDQQVGKRRIEGHLANQFQVGKTGRREETARWGQGSSRRSLGMSKRGSELKKEQVVLKCIYKD